VCFESRTIRLTAITAVHPTRIYCCEPGHEEADQSGSDLHETKVKLQLLQVDDPPASERVDNCRSDAEDHELYTYFKSEGVWFARASGCVKHAGARRHSRGLGFESDVGATHRARARLLYWIR
jgi:hypothetical protein